MDFRIFRDRPTIETSDPQQERQNRARAANKSGINAWDRGDYASALVHFEEAAKLWPDDRNIAANVHLARKQVHYSGLINSANAANSRGDLREALRFARAALQVHDDPDLRSGILRTDAFLTAHEADALHKQGKLEEALVLYRKAAAHPAVGDAAFRQWLADQEVRVAGIRQVEERRLKEKAQRERNLPDANRLNDEAATLLQRGDPDTALARLDAALRLVPNEPRISANWYIARATIDFRNGSLDDTIENLERAVQLDPANGAARVALDKARSERTRQGENIRQALAITLDRLRDAPNDGSVKNAGEELKSVERHSREASALEKKEASADESRQGFDSPGKKSGTLVYPDVSGRMPALAASLPERARNDPAVAQTLAYYQKLDTLKAESETKIAEIKQNQKTGGGDAAVLAAQLGTATNDLKRYTEDQAKVKDTIKKRVKDLGIEWNEAGTNPLSVTPRAVVTQSNQLNFIEN